MPNGTLVCGILNGVEARAALNIGRFGHHSSSLAEGRTPKADA